LGGGISSESLPCGRDGWLREAADRLIELYTATNNSDELAMWRAERAKYPEAERSTLPDKK
jgi:hypothetical protein